MTVCRRYASSHDEAKELFQECFYQILTCVNKYDSGKGVFEAWLYKLCYYTILGQRKKNIKFYELNTSVLEVEEDEKPDYPISEEDLISEIQRLPEGYRMILNLYAFEGLTHDEIADCLGITASTSRSQLTRARATLKKRIKNNKKMRYATKSI